MVGGFPCGIYWRRVAANRRMANRSGQTLEQLTALRRRRQIQIGSIILVGLIAALIAADHFGIFGYHGDDWANFDSKRFVIARINEQGQPIVKKNGREVALQLIAINPPAELPAFMSYLQNHLVGKTVILKLEPLETRSKDKLLRCYVYLTEEDCLNVNLLQQGLATTDHQARHTLQSLTNGAEADAKKHKRGIWR